MKKTKKQQDTLSFFYHALSMLRFLLLCSVAASLLFTFVFRKEQVKGTSMYPALKDGQHVLINVAASYMTKIHRFDVVVVKHQDSDNLWVKRVIGLPGEVVTYKDDILYIDGKRAAEKFLDREYIKRIKQERDLLNFTSDFTSKKLEEDEYLLVGDNRVDSIDSRYNEIGPFKREYIIAKGVLVISPFSEMRYVGNGG